MNGIVHIRIDDRLIHGQVATRWTAATKATRILIPNDEVAVNDVQKQILRMAAPSGVNTSLISVEKAGQNITAGKYSNQQVLVVAKSPIDILRLIELGVEVNHINVGNMANREGSRQIKNSVSVLPEEEQAFKELLAAGISITAQMVPDEKSPMLEELLNNN